MFREHPDIPFTARSGQVWRYMGLDKLVSLLQTSSLFFCRIDRFQDPYEGMVPIGTAKALGEVRARSWLAEGDESAIKRGKLARIYASVEPAPPLGIEVAGFSGHVLANCWHRLEHESEAMWRMYAGDGNGLAVVTTGKSLASAFTCNEDVFIGDVAYFDYAKLPPDFPIHRPFGLQLAKRKAFAHEREVRALSMVPIEWSPPPSTDGIQFPQWWRDRQPGHMLEVDLGRLIQRIVVSPTADSWFLDLVQRLRSDSGLDTTVSKSALLEPPEGYPSYVQVESAAADYLETTAGLPIPKFIMGGSVSAI